MNMLIQNKSQRRPAWVSVSLGMVVRTGCIAWHCTGSSQLTNWGPTDTQLIFEVYRHNKPMNLLIRQHSTSKNTLTYIHLNVPVSDHYYAARDTLHTSHWAMNKYTYIYSSAGAAASTWIGWPRHVRLRSHLTSLNLSRQQDWRRRKKQTRIIVK